MFDKVLLQEQERKKIKIWRECFEKARVYLYSSFGLIIAFMDITGIPSVLFINMVVGAILGAVAFYQGWLG